jgi:plastocyanin
MKPRANCSLAAALSVVALMLVSAATPAAAPTPPDGPRIAIKDFMFAPMELTTHVGAVVTWVNQDDEPHTIVSATGLFRSGALDTDMTYTFKFDKPGTYRVFCSIHPQMTATIIVE